MGLFDFLEKAQERLNAQVEEFAQKAQNGSFQFPQQNTIETQKEKKPSKKAEKTRQLIIRRFYADYPETPYISYDRSNDWIEKAELFPMQSIVPKTMMKRYSDNLLPGHVYMLYWLQKYTNKKIPSYFEYKYGIDFEKEKVFLFSNGFLDEANKPTAKGEAAIKRHSTVIENHSQPKPDRSIEGISKQTFAQRDSFIRDGFEHYEYIANQNCCEVCAALDGKHFPVSELQIGVNAPPMHDGCSCSIAAWEDSAEYEAWLDYLSKGGSTKEWNKLKAKR